MATTREEDRIACSLGKGTLAGIKFEENKGLCGAGVLFLLPALLAQGLLKTKEVFQWPSKLYYGLESIVLTLAFMALARIKNPEQLKQCKPGEIGRVIGLDRIPEVRCLREKLKLLSSQGQSQELNNLLIDHWYSGQSAGDAEFLYIDGHLRIYYGEKANLPVKYISRQKLCLSATTEYWVNDAQGMPVMMVMGELTEKLQSAIEHQIIPQLQQTRLLPEDTSEALKPRCTFIFDREAYKPLDNLPSITNKQMEYKTILDMCKIEEEKLIAQRTQISPRIKLKEMPQQKRYNKLKTESKMLINVIRMICYRAESSVASCISPYLARAEDEKRMVVKQIIGSNADLLPDYQNKSLTITLHSLSAHRFNRAAHELSKLLNDTETIFPGTDLRMIFKISAFSNCEK